MFKKLFQRLTGVESINAAREAAERLKQEAEEAAKKAIQEAEIAKAEVKKLKEEEEAARLGPKERATAQSMPYVGVLDTHVNPDDIKNGFFDLDWNEFFIQELIENGYGTDADPEEEIVDRWFRDLCGEILDSEGIQGTRYGGYINTTSLGGGKASVS